VTGSFVQSDVEWSIAFAATTGGGCRACLNRLGNALVIAASNRDLRKAVERGTFHGDLFYRLQVFDINIPCSLTAAPVWFWSAIL
jgi:hypothetical protein